MELPNHFHSFRDKEKGLFTEQFQQELRYWLPCFKNIRNASQVRDKRIRHAIEYLTHQYQNKPTLTEVALHVGMSNGRLSHLIKKETHWTFKEVLNAIRTAHAVEMLMGDEQHKVATVAYDAGFGSDRHLTREFRTYTGMTPSEFKRMAEMIIFDTSESDNICDLRMLFGQT